MKHHASGCIAAYLCKQRPAPVASGVLSGHTFSHVDPAQLSSALQHYIDSSSPRQGQKLHAHILKTGFKPGTNISIKLLILHLKSGCLNYARQVFDQLPTPTLSAYNYLLSGYMKHGCTLEALDVIRQLSCSNERPDVFTLSMVLKLSARLNWVGLAKEVHGLLIRLALHWDDFVSTGLVDSYSKNGKIDYASQVFNQMSRRSLICVTAMITGYLKEGLLSKAEEMFETAIEKDVVVFNAMIEGYSKWTETAKRSIEIYVDLMRLDFHPTISTFASIIGACTILTEVGVGQQIHGQLLRTDLILDVRAGSALIDMYSKFGRIQDARRVFNEMHFKNVVTWTSMIDGYGKHGDCDKALQLFKQMREMQTLKPNYVTFLSALASCSHAGLLSDGWEIFHSMERDYSIKPKMEHYACMVDLLGRLGRLKEAVEFIRQIPERPNTDVWATLLAASNLHGDVKLATLAANEVFKLSGGERPGAYMALSNAFAATDKWGNVCELRELMKNRRVSKAVGCSWVGD